VIKKSSYKVLNKLADVASRCTSHKINVHGHTDTTGRNKLNQRLSKKRAQAVAAYLAKKGVNPKYVHAVGHGSSKPIASNNTSAGRARNRRIELTVED
jgi:outer membrane protein OmpA-like peptidoglycan-associated protein